MDQSRDCRRKERESNPQGSSLARFRAGCRRPSACPSASSSSGGRNRTRVLPVNSRALVPARAPPESSRQTVGMAGFEPAISCSRSRRISQAFPHPESSRSPTSAQRESNPHVRHGKAVGYRYIMGTIAVPELSKSREHRVGLEPTSPPYEGGVLAAGRPVPASRVGPEGLEPSPNRLRAGRSAARTSVPIGIASRPGRSRTSAARLSAECSPVELQAVADRFSRWSAPGELNPSSLAYKASALPLS